MSKKLILLVEDSHQLLDLYKCVLGDEYEYIEVSTGQDACLAYELRSGKIDLILTDNDMPIMTGIEMILFLKNKYETIPNIIMLSGNLSVSEQAVSLGATFIEKPCRVHVLKEVISEILA